MLFVMFETNANEASEYLSQYFSLKIVLVALAYTVAAILLWTRLRPVYIPSPRRYLVSFALLYGLILHPIAMNTFIKHKSMEKTLDSGVTNGTRRAVAIYYWLLSVPFTARLAE